MRFFSATAMAIQRISRNKPRPTSLLFIVLISATILIVLFSFPSSDSASRSYVKTIRPTEDAREWKGYLYWGDRIDCPGKHCDSCEGLGHQESSLRCALEEAMVLRRVFVMPSRMCISAIHNKKGILHQTTNASLEDRWTENSCAMDSLYDMDLISKTVPVILDNSKTWHYVLTRSMKLGERGVRHVEGVTRAELRDNKAYSMLFLINHTASPLSWFAECKDRSNRSAIMLPYSFLPMMAAKRLREAAEQACHNEISSLGFLKSVFFLINMFCRQRAIVKTILGDYDAIHVRRGDKIKTRKDRFGVARTLHPHLDRDTRPEAMLIRLARWIPPGRMIFIASNERTPGFFSPLSIRYRLAYSSNFSSILDPVIENNYQLFMIERLVMHGARTFIKTFKEDDTDLSLTDDPKKNMKHWQLPVYTIDETPS
ncbi:hypothetical protein EJ110_NYTH08361 [Nymphaea thermarum]|nr:hypothetical protein EJ110_NYTH08361 [Nymphaea thermarum]